MLKIGEFSIGVEIGGSGFGFPIGSAPVPPAENYDFEDGVNYDFEDGINYEFNEETSASYVLNENATDKLLFENGDFWILE